MNLNWAARLGREPLPRMIKVSEKTTAHGLSVYLIKIRKYGRSRLRELNLKKVTEVR
jgi:hypothetical protein